MSPKKKVLIFSFAYYPHMSGAELAVREITDRIVDADFDLVSYDLDGELTRDEQFGNVHIYRIKSFSKYLYPIKSFFLAWKLQRKNNYSCYWSMMANAGFVPMFLKFVFPKTKFVLTLQEGDPIPQIKRRVWFVYPFFKMIFRRADLVTVLSNYLAGFAKDMGAQKIEIIPNGVDFNNFVYSTKNIDPKGKIVLVTTGRLEKKNALDDIIKALKFLPPNFVFKSVGAGTEEQSLRSLVSQLGLESRVEFLTWVSHKELGKILSESNIFVRPSLTEGLGSSFIEAMGAGLPIVGTPVGGIPDFLEDGETGVFCRVGDPRSIADAVLKIANNQEMAKHLSETAYNLARERHDWKNISDRFNKIFLGING
ncbi:MAG: glycosyltransferase family 4 protein [Candidatus Paceibacterota bacterium]|jgi:colanic acid/amylovoran biosynthesis glycosyltransferase